MNNVYHLPGLLPPSLPRILVPVPSADHIPLLLLIGCLSKVCVSQLNKATYRPLISLRRKSTAAVTQYRLTSRASKTSFPISTPAMRLTWGWIWSWRAFQKARVDISPLQPTFSTSLPQGDSHSHSLDQSLYPHLGLPSNCGCRKYPCCHRFLEVKRMRGRVGFAEVDHVHHRHQSSSRWKEEW